MTYQGLTDNEVFKLQKKYGLNEIAIEENHSWFFILLAQLKSPLIYILIIVGLISLSFGNLAEAGLIEAVIILNILMGFFQEYNAKKTQTALKKILPDKIVVIRNSQRQKIEVKNLAPGDLAVLGAGDKVPADGKIIAGTNLLINEAILTGEEEAIIKTSEEKTPEKEKSLVFMGTTVISGRGIIEILKIGQATEIGKISQSLAKIKEEKTPLQVKLEKFSKTLGIIILIVSSLIFIVGMYYQKDLWEMLKLSIILAIAAIPEGLPVAITIVMSLGMRRILAKNGLVKKLLSIETLGSTSVICTDKTGTLTEGLMKVSKWEFVNNEKAFLALALANDQRSNLEIALWEFIKKNSDVQPEEIALTYPRIHEEPFNSEKKYALSINKIKEAKTAFLIGAPEIILNFCRISGEEKNKILGQIEEWGKEGLKVLGATIKEEGNLEEKNGFTWLGAVGINDPIRPKTKNAIIEAQKAGIKVKIVTGDYRATAEKIASLLGFNLKPENIIEGKELDLITDEELKNRINEISLFSRVTPTQKQKIVSILQEKGEIVAMTGDGVNDAPALKKADIGVVMSTGSDVAKEAGDLILLDNNFKTIVAACEEGRLIFANIKKVVGYALSNSFAEIFLIFGAMLAGFPAPLTVVQILWIHLICDGPPDIMLSFEPKEKNLMQENPKDIKKEKILDRPMKFLIFAISAATGLSALYFFWHFYKQTGDLKLARTIAFATAAAVDLIYIFAFKNTKQLIFKTKNFFKNKLLLLGVAYGFILLFSAIYLPFFQRILETVSLQPIHWIYVFAVGIATALITEMVKLVKIR